MGALQELGSYIEKAFPEMKIRDIKEYAELKYPHLIPLLRMHVKSYRLNGFGYVMRMETSMMNLMKLSTFSFMPSEGTSVPFLLIDTMSMGKKRLAYVELYDCRKQKDPLSALKELSEKYSSVSDYDEKPAWYVKERMEGSLIKCGTPDQEDELFNMITDAIGRYASCIDPAEKEADNLKELESFRERMITEGNPSSGTLNMVLGKEKAVEFFKNIVMPM